MVAEGTRDIYGKSFLMETNLHLINLAKTGGHPWRTEDGDNHDERLVMYKGLIKRIEDNRNQAVHRQRRMSHIRRKKTRMNLVVLD